MTVGAALFVAASLSFSPGFTPLPHAAKAVGTLQHVKMAGWNDPFNKPGGFQAEKLDVGKTDFDDLMEKQQKQAIAQWGGGFAVITVAFFAFLFAQIGGL
jgi:hypothetical protein